jgi:hypothetical protein
MASILHAQSVEIDETHVCLVHQLGGVQRLTAALSFEPRAGDAAELAIDDLDQRIERCLIAVAPSAEERRDVLWVFDS